MPADKLAKSPLQTNLQGLIDESKLTLNGWAVSMKVSQPTVFRAVKKGVSPGWDVLKRIADAIKVEPWQLYAPDLGAGLFRLNDKHQVIPVRVAAPPPVELPGPPRAITAPPRKAKRETTPVVKAGRNIKPPKSVNNKKASEA